MPNMTLIDGRTVNRNGYCEICGSARLSAEIPTCGAIACRDAREQRIAAAPVYALDPLPCAIAQALWLDVRRPEEDHVLDGLSRAIGKSNGYVNDADLEHWLVEHYAHAIGQRQTYPAIVRVVDALRPDELADIIGIISWTLDGNLIADRPRLDLGRVTHLIARLKAQQARRPS
jgi:hypothetical protein